MLDAVRSPLACGALVLGACAVEKVEKREERKVDAGSNGPIGGRENFWRSSCA